MTKRLLVRELLNYTSLLDSGIWRDVTTPLVFRDLDEYIASGVKTQLKAPEYVFDFSSDTDEEQARNEHLERMKQLLSVPVFDPIVIDTNTRGGFDIYDGHHRLWVAAYRKDVVIPVSFLCLDYNELVAAFPTSYRRGIVRVNENEN